MTLAYTRSGNPDAPAIIFLHGMAMGQWMWTDQIEHFADYDCYNVDLPGHGDSHAVEWDSFAQTAHQVIALIEQQIPNKPVYVVGMSLGAIVGLFMLAQRPTLIERAVLTGAISQTPPRWLMTVQEKFLSLMLPTAIGKRLFAKLLQLPADTMPEYQRSMAAFSMPAFRRIVAQLKAFTLPAGLAQIRTPALFATGDKDAAINRDSVAALAELLPDGVGVLAPAVHHGWNGEDPTLFNAMVRAWLDGQPLPDGLIPAIK